MNDYRTEAAMEELIDWVRMGRRLTCKLLDIPIGGASKPGAWSQWRIGDADIASTAPLALLAAKRIAVKSIVSGLVEYEETNGATSSGVIAHGFSSQRRH